MTGFNCADSFRLGAAVICGFAACTPVGAFADEPFVGDYPEIGASIRVGPEVLCSIADGMIDGVPHYKSAFPLAAFQNPTPNTSDFTATAVRTDLGVEVTVHVTPDVIDTRSAVSLLTAFLAHPKQLCPDPAQTLPVGVGVENLGVITESGKAIDFHYADPEDAN